MSIYHELEVLGFKMESVDLGGGVGIHYDTIDEEKDFFKPINEGQIGMYVCGPTVYSNVHLGNVRTFMSFDMIFRYFKHLGYKVRYVRNITDAGHLENDADEGEDRIAKKARLEQIEPMEVVQMYPDWDVGVSLTRLQSRLKLEPAADSTHLALSVETLVGILVCDRRILVFLLQVVGVLTDLLNRIDDVIQFVVGHRRMKRKSDPPRFV